ncbi:tetratricopeptide repeat protein [Alistipes sp. OttesenSCG-928-B03]|nr:tetratricopeptide repeat protein [Alistipes sp. OttesenSCG-928-B03]
MSKLRTGIIVAIALVAVACGTQTRSVRGPVVEGREYPEGLPLEPAKLGYKADQEPLFYYTEGLKKSELYKDAESAVRLFDRAIGLDSLHSPSYYAAANSLALGDPVRALGYSTTANRLDTANVWYRSQLGRLLIMNARFPEALETYTTLLELAPNDPENYRMMSALYEATGKPFAALMLLDSAEMKFGRLEELSSMKRELLMKVHLFDRAIEESRELIAEYPYKYENYLILGELYMMSRNDSLAYENIQRATELNPTGIAPLILLTEYHKTRGDDNAFLATSKRIFMSDEMDVKDKIRFYRDLTIDRKYYGANYFAISDLITTLAAKYPDNYEVMDLYASNMMAGGQTEEALNIYKDYLTDTTSIKEPYFVIIGGEAFLERPDSVAMYTRMALERFPDDLELLIRYGDIQRYMKREKEALKTYRRALKFAESDSSRAVVIGMIGDVYHAMDDDRRCFREYDRALKLDPNNALILNNYAYFLSERDEDLDKAVVMAERVMELEPGNATYIDTYGWVLYKLGRYEDAKKVMRQAVSLDKHASETLFLHYGDVLFMLDDRYMARFYWEKARDAGYDAAEIEQRLQKLDSK